MFKKMLKSLGAAGLAATVAASAVGAAADYVRPNASYESAQVPSYLNPVPEAKPLWSVTLGRPGEAYEYHGNRLAVGGGKAYYLKDGKLVAANARTGAVAWTFGQRLTQPIDYRDGSLFVFDDNGKLHRVDGDTGKAKWTFDLTPYEGEYGLALNAASMAHDDAAIYISILGTLLALDRENGKLIWNSDRLQYGGFPLLHGELLLVSTTESGAITTSVTYAFEKRTGKTVWRSGSNASPLLVKDGLLYAQDTWPAYDGATHQFRLAVVDIATGEAAGGHSYIRVPEGVDPRTAQAYVSATDGEWLYVQGSDGAVYRFDYTRPGDEQQPRIYYGDGTWVAGPYHNKLFFEGDRGQGMYAVKLLDGNRFVYEGINNLVSRLDFHGNGMFAGQTDGVIYALDVTTGKAYFRYDTGARNFDPFLVEDGVLFAQAEETLYAFRLPQPLLNPLPAEPLPGLNYQATDATLSIDGERQTFKPSPVIIESRMYVPLRALFEAVGAKVNYDEATGNVHVSYRDRAFVAPRGEKIGNVVYVPIRDVGALLGVGIAWDDATRTVVIETAESANFDAQTAERGA